jgi:endonuclease/exonuclease/phosphatase (EEP) superfamily protein YafD
MRKAAPLFRRYSIAAAWVYFTLLFGWLLVDLILGDRFAYLGFVNILAVYLFFPLPLAGLVAALTHRREIIIGTILGAAAFLVLWGTLFLPRLSAPPKGGNPHSSLTVMTFNVLGLQAFTAPLVDVIQAVDADVVFLQEINTRHADALQRELIVEYPYQILDPVDGVSGMGLISRFPLRETREQLPLEWVGAPQVIELDFEGVPVTLLNFHTFSLQFSPLEAANLNFRYREAQAQALADFAARTPGPLILAGDANTTPLSEAYDIITTGSLRDAFQEAGWGLGHTFPGSKEPGSHRFHIGDWYIPQWLARIDYIFVSPEWGVAAARVAPFDGVSDHRGVIAELVLGE